MGNSLACCQQPEETKSGGEYPALEPTIVATEPAESKVVYEEVKLAVEEKVEEVKDAVEDIKDAVETKVEETKETVEQVVEEIAHAENATDAPLVVVVEKDKTVEVTTEEVKETVEKDVEKEKACVTPLIVVFDLKGERKTVEFTYKPHGFEYSQASKKSSACCGSTKTLPPVAVTKVVPKEQAASLGMERGAIIRQVNGKDIAELKQMDLFTEHLAILPNAPDCN